MALNNGNALEGLLFSLIPLVMTIERGPDNASVGASPSCIGGDRSHHSEPATSCLRAYLPAALTHCIARAQAGGVD